MILGIYILSKKYFNILKVLFLSIILAVIAFSVRLLPIYFGVHMVINIVLTISIMAIIGIPIIKSIYSTLLVYLILSLCEFINIFILSLLNIDINSEALNPFTKLLYEAPSLVFLLLFILSFNYMLKKKKGVKNVS